MCVYIYIYIHVCPPAHPIPSHAIPSHPIPSHPVPSHPCDRELELFHCDDDPSYSSAGCTAAPEPKASISNAVSGRGRDDLRPQTDPQPPGSCRRASPDFPSIAVTFPAWRKS